MSNHARRAVVAVFSAFLAAALPALAQERTVPRGFGPGLPSAELAALPQTPGAKGDQQRHYYFEEAKQEMPYRLYVPKSYDPSKPMPLVVALHGYSGNHDYFFALTDDLPGLLETHGFILVAPMGYNTGSWYGLGGPATRGENPQNTSEIYPEDGKLSVTELGEKDVMNVIELVRKEYNTDPRRTFLMGHSMGGAGTWHIGQKYPQMWKAIAPMSGTGRFSTVNTNVMAKIPVIVSVGGEETAQLAPSKEAVDQINAAGGEAVYLEIEGAGHVPMIRGATPAILEFFAKHAK
jgi:predicted peptidase